MTDMRKCRFPDEQIAGFIKPFYKWRAKFGVMEVPDARRLRELEDENTKLKMLLTGSARVVHGLARSSYPLISTLN